MESVSKIKIARYLGLLLRNIPLRLCPNTFIAKVLSLREGKKTADPITAGWVNTTYRREQNRLAWQYDRIGQQGLETELNISHIGFPLHGYQFLLTVPFIPHNIVFAMGTDYILVVQRTPSAFVEFLCWFSRE